MSANPRVSFSDLTNTVHHTDGKVASYTQGTLTYTYSYDSATQVSKTDNNGHRIVYTLNDNGIITSVTDPLNLTTTRQVSTQNNVTSIITIDANGNSWVKEIDDLRRTIASIDPLGNKTVYTYEGDNTKPSTITTPLGHTTTITYDANQNPLTVTDAKGNTQRFKYDAKGNAIEITDAKGNKTTIAYNSNNQPTSITNALGYTTTIAYDDLGRQTSITDAEGRTTTYTYDAMDRIVKTTDAMGNVVEYSYDKSGRLVSLKDPVGNVTTYTYDEYGRVATETRPDGGKTTYAYNTDNTIKSITRRDGKVVSYTYDAAKRPISQSVDGDTISYTYDAMGNIKTKYNKLTKETTTYTFNARNQLINYVKQNENNETIKTLTFTYDAFGRRVSKTEDGVTQKYLYDGDDIIAILDNDNNVIATITHDENIDTPLSITNANGTFYYHRDHQGSIIALTDESGNVVESFTYDNHYGTIIEHTKTVETDNPYGYTGREVDADDLYYYRARYYDPTLQRFISEDPIGFSSGDFNWYRYVGNDPVLFRDPWGLWDPAANVQPYFPSKPSQSDINNWNNSRKNYGKTLGSGIAGAGPFGPICGSGPSASWIPDITPLACQRHDDCYDKCAKSCGGEQCKIMCDLQLWDSNPLYGSATYWFGGSAYFPLEDQCGCK